MCCVTVGLVAELGQQEQVVPAEAGRPVPVALSVLETPGQDHRVPRPLVRLLLPDGRAQAAVADLTRWSLLAGFLARGAGCRLPRRQPQQGPCRASVRDLARVERADPAIRRAGRARRVRDRCKSGLRSACRQP